MRHVRGSKARVVATGVGIMAALVLLVAAPAARAQTAPEPNRPPCEIPPCEPEPGTAIRATFYYPWWDGFDTATQTPRDKWSACSATWDYPYDANAHYHPDFDANGIFEKAIDLYDDGLESTMVTHLQRMAQASISGLIASWWGVGLTEDTKLEGSILKAAHQVAAVDVTAYYESLPNHANWTEIQAFLNRFMSLRQDNPGQFLYVDGRPVVFVYHPGNTNCAILDLWNQGLAWVQNTYQIRPFLVVEMADSVLTGRSNHSAADYSWHHYSPSGSGGYTHFRAYGKLQTNTLRPGFWRCTSGTAGQARSLSAWQSNVNWANTRYPKYFELITSWNEWLEMTSVEPAIEWYSTSHLGRYLDILSQNPL